MEKDSKLEEIEGLLDSLLKLLFGDKVEKEKFQVGDNKYLITIGNRVLTIDKKAVAPIWTNNAFYVYRLTPQKEIEISYAKGTKLYFAKDEKEIQRHYDSYVFSLIVKDVLTMLAVGFVLFLIIPKAYEFAQTVVKTLPEFVPKLKISTAQPIKADVDLEGNWIHERLADIDKSDVVEWRQKIIYNRLGKKHYLVFAKLKDGKWILYKIIHPADEGLPYVEARHALRRKQPYNARI